MNKNRITILHDSFGRPSALRQEWGFAALVGLFESTIAQVTALAVLLPVVAGQSGHAGAQALAGLINGVAVAATTGLAVYVWRRSLALVGVITLARVISLAAARAGSPAPGSRCGSPPVVPPRCPQAGFE